MQIEKELLAIVFAVNKFHQYVYGKSVLMELDHKSLESIVKKSLAAAPPRLQHMLLQLQKYSFTIAYKPGKEFILADTLSRAYIDENDNADRNLEEDLICDWACKNRAYLHKLHMFRERSISWCICMINNFCKLYIIPYEFLNKYMKFHFDSISKY